MSGRLIPGAALVYENVNGVVYARYRDPPHNTIPRWAIGGTDLKDNSISYNDFKNIMTLSETNTVIKNHLDKLLDIYFILKDSK